MWYNIILYNMYVYTLIRINLRLHLELKFFSSSASYACWQFVLLRAGSCIGKLCHHFLLPHLSLLLPATASTSSRSWYCKFGAVWAGQMLRTGLFSHSTLCRFSEALCTPPTLELSWSSLGTVEADRSSLSLSIYVIEGTPQRSALVTLLGNIQDTPLTSPPCWLHPAHRNHSCILSQTDSGRASSVG